MAGKIITKTCKGCKKEFSFSYVTGPKRAYCTDKCRASYPKPKGVHGRRILVPCQQCGNEMTLKPSEAKKRKFCSTACYGLSCAANWLERKIDRGIKCAQCGSAITRKIRGSNDAGKYCSRECAFEAIAEQALARLPAREAARAAREAQVRINRIVLPEVSALRRIGNNIRTRSRACDGCGAEIIRRRAFFRYCTAECGESHRAKQRKEYRSARKRTEAGRATRRRQKSLRRARIRGAEVRESFDPFEIFDRDGWRCKCCGTKTPKAHRGTHKPTAPELDHIVPISKGGEHSRRNTQLLCRQCNSDKAAGTAQDQLLLIG